MSQGRFSPPLAPEDDWFDEPEWFPEPDVSPSAGGEEPHEPRTTRPEPGRASRAPTRVRDRRVLAAAAVGALVLLVAGVLTARALTGSDGETTVTTPTTSDTITTTPTTATSPTSTTPTTTETTTTDPAADTTTPAQDDDALRPGDESEEVRQLQTDLVALGYSTGGIDGKYGPATEQAVREFQTSSGLTVDGVAGPATLAALSQALNG
jgi:hypothetical protein